jgi:hypothetical protein
MTNNFEKEIALQSTQNKGKRASLRLVFGGLAACVVVVVLFFLLLGERFLLSVLPDYSKDMNKISQAQAKTYVAIYKTSKLFRTPTAELGERLSLSLLYSGDANDTNYTEWKLTEAIKIADDYISGHSGQSDKYAIYVTTWRLSLANKLHGITTLKDSENTIKNLVNDLRRRLDNNQRLSSFERSTILSHLGLIHALYFQDKQATGSFFELANKVSNDAVRGGSPQNTYMKLYQGIGLCYLGESEGAQLLSDWWRAANNNIEFYKTMTLEWDFGFAAILAKFSKDKKHVCKDATANVFRVMFDR